MSNLVIRNNSESINYSGTNFEGLENEGSKHLCVRTGVNPNDIRKYGLTSSPLNDRYSQMKMRISNAGGGAAIVR